FREEHARGAAFAEERFHSVPIRERLAGAIKEGGHCSSLHTEVSARNVLAAALHRTDVVRPAIQLALDRICAVEPGLPFWTMPSSRAPRFGRGSPVALDHRGQVIGRKARTM